MKNAGKENFMIISTSDPHGGPIKLLGTEFDSKLLMNQAAHKCAKSASWKMKALLRAKRFYSTADLVMMYKSHVLSLVEHQTPGIHFASTHVLQVLDVVQIRFLRELGITEEEAFLHFNLAPLGVRRDIGILGVIHRAALRQGPEHLWRFFRIDTAPNRHSDRLYRRHSMHLEEVVAVRNLNITRRSAFGSIRVYNLLPEEAVEHRDVSSFQSFLTSLVRDRLVGHDYRWKFLLSPRCDFFNRHPLTS